MKKSAIDERSFAALHQFAHSMIFRRTMSKRFPDVGLSFYLYSVGWRPGSLSARASSGPGIDNYQKALGCCQEPAASCRAVVFRIEKISDFSIKNWPGTRFYVLFRWQPPADGPGLHPGNPSRWSPAHHHRQSSSTYDASGHYELYPLGSVNYPFDVGRYRWTITCVFIQTVHRRSSTIVDRKNRALTQPPHPGLLIAQ